MTAVGRSDVNKITTALNDVTGARISPVQLPAKSSEHQHVVDGAAVTSICGSYSSNGEECMTCIK